MSLRIIHIACFLFFCFSIKAQELVFSNITDMVELPSQECYKVHQDKQGYLWFSTDNGLCRYGNSSLKVFDKRNGLPESSIYSMSEDPTGKMWFATSDNRILFFDGEQLVEAPFNKAYQKLAASISSFPTPFILDMSDPKNAFVANYYYSCYIRNNRITRIPGNNEHTITRFIKHKGYRMIPNSHRLKNNPSSTVLITKGSVHKKIDLKHLSISDATFWNTPTVLCGNTDFVGINNILVCVNDDLSHSLISFPGRIFQLRKSKTGGLWVCVQNHGIYYYPNVHTMKLMHHSLVDFSVTDVCEDNEGGIWCTTLEKGIFYSKNSELMSYSAFPGLSKPLSLLKYTNGNLFASSSSELLYNRSSDKFHPNNYSWTSGTFSDIIKQGDYWIITGFEQTVRIKDNFTFKEFVAFNNGPVGNKELTSGNGRLFGIINKSLTELNTSKIAILYHYNSVFSSRSFIHKKDDLFLFGGDQGLYELNVTTLQSRKIPGAPQRIRKLLKTASGRIWIATKNDGIYYLEGEKIHNISVRLKLSIPAFYDLTEDLNGNIWAGSNRGLYRFMLENDQWKSQLYTPAHGLPSNTVYKVAADSTSIWFSTYEGLFSFPLEKNFIRTNYPLIHLQQLKVNGKTRINTKRTLIFPYHQASCRFTFDILTFKNGRNTKLEYILKRNDQWIKNQLEGNEILLENLTPGNYQLMVYGINNDGVKSKRPEIFLIRIDAPFWQTWWFILAVSLIIALIILLIVRAIVKRIRKKEEAKTQINKLIAEYQITALQAQMNPHFIFNAINTIQGYILEKNEEEAYNYLAKFSKLIRTVLHHSQEKVLLLEHEIEALNLYIELEKLRFDNCFDYELKLSEGIDPHDIHLPGMILQPYVENAIWHGIVNLRESRRGKLVISINRTQQLLIVWITDNGIGREMAMKYNKDKRHKSVGMQLTGERLKAMNQLHGYETAQVIITDLFNENGDPAGTQVEVRIPINVET